jgi:hypothetical protein
MFLLARILRTRLRSTSSTMSPRLSQRPRLHWKDPRGRLVGADVSRLMGVATIVPGDPW